MKSTSLPIRNWLMKGLSLILVLTLCSTAYMFFNSASAGKWNGWHKINFFAFGLACLAVFCTWLVEAVRIYLITSGLGENISLTKVMGINLAATFTGNITPYASGGIPTQIYLFCQNGINPGKSSAVVTLRIILSSLFYTLFVPFLLLFYRVKFTTGIMHKVTTVAIPLAFILSAVLILFILKPKLAKYLFSFIIRILNFKCFGNKLQPVLTKLLDELDSFHKSIKQFRKGINIYLAFICSAFYGICFYSVAPLLMYAFGVNTPGIFIESILFQFVLVFVVAYLPVPSGSGVMEVGFYYGFGFIPPQVKAIFIVVWRFLSYYLATFIGGIILLKMINHSPEVVATKESPD